MNEAISLLLEYGMAQLIVRNIEEQLVHELELRAARNARSAEEEHRQILRSALRVQRSGSSLKELLAEMPDVGSDGDFERIQDLGRTGVSTLNPWS